VVLMHSAAGGSNVDTGNLLIPCHMTMNILLLLT
jgi:hypothetical protein